MAGPLNTKVPVQYHGLVTCRLCGHLFDDVAVVYDIDAIGEAHRSGNVPLYKYDRPPPCANARQVANCCSSTSLRRG